MSTKSISSRPERPEAAAEDPGGAVIIPETEPPSPTLTHYQRLANEFEAALENIIKVIPKLEQPHPTTAQFVRTHRNIPIPFISTAVAGMDRHAELRPIGRNPEQSRDTLQLDEAFRPIVDRVSHFLQNLEFTLDSRMAILGADALQAYCLAKAFGRDPGGAHMLQLAEDLKRALGQRGPKKDLKKAALKALKKATERAVKAGAVGEEVTASTN
jgi:hypothetical protein